MNVIIQALFFSLKFRANVLRIDYKIAAKLKLSQSPLMQLQKLFALLLKSTRPYIAPKEFRSTLPNYFKNSFMQQDASEFFKTVSDLLESDAKKLDSTNLFTKHFEGIMKRKIKCEDCKTETNREEKFIDLYIPIDGEEM
jgi:ubiquitin C-terminal hydrolase